MAESDPKSTVPPSDAQRLTPDGTGRGQQAGDAPAKRRREIGGPEGPEPTRYGDWERNGRCTDF